MKKVFVALVFLMGIAATAKELELTRAVGPLVEVTNKGTAVSVEYCPDNTCESFALIGGPPDALSDFALAYFYGVSAYSYLAELQSRSDLPEVKALIRRYAALCPQPSQRDATRCIAAARLAKKHRIKATFVRYDEGRKNVTPITLETR